MFTPKPALTRLEYEAMKWWKLSSASGSSNFVLPAPMVPDVTVEDLAGNRFSPGWPALIDTGSDRTIIPQSAVAILGIRIASLENIRILSSSEINVPTVFVALSIPNVGRVTVKAIVLNRTTILLGRDVLKNLVFTFDGHSSTFYLGRPSLLKRFWRSFFRRGVSLNTV